MKKLYSKDLFFISGGFMVHRNGLNGGGGGMGPVITGSLSSVAGYTTEKLTSGEEITTEGITSAAIAGGITGKLGSMANKSGPHAEVALSGMSIVIGSKAGRLIEEYKSSDTIDEHRDRENNADNSSRVICTHFYKKGMLSRELWHADMEYTLKHLPQSMVNGYHLWAIPYVKLMRKSPLAEKLMYPIAYHRAREIAYKMGKLEKGSIRGKLFRAILEPISLFLGMFTKEHKYQELWRNA